MAFLLPYKQEVCHKFCGCSDAFPEQSNWPSNWSFWSQPSKMQPDQYEFHALYYSHVCPCRLDVESNTVYPSWIRVTPLQGDKYSLENWTWPPTPLPALKRTGPVNQPKTLEQLAFDYCAKTVTCFVVRRFHDSDFSRNLIRWHVAEARQAARWLEANYFNCVTNLGVWHSLVYKPEIRTMDFLPKIQRSDALNGPFYLLSFIDPQFHSHPAFPLRVQELSGLPLQSVLNQYYRDPDSFRLPKNDAVAREQKKLQLVRLLLPGYRL